MPQHFFKWLLISGLIGAIAAVWIGRYIMTVARNHAESVMKQHISEIATSICKNEGYDGGAMIDFANPARSRCFAKSEARELGFGKPEPPQ